MVNQWKRLFAGEALITTDLLSIGQLTVLVTLAAIAIVSHQVIVTGLTVHRPETEMIDLAGQRRYLSQMIVVKALQREESRNHAEEAAASRELTATLDRLEGVEAELHHYDLEKPAPEFLQVHQALDRLLAQLLARGRELLERPPPDRAATQALVEAAERFLPVADAIVHLRARAEKEKLSQTHRLSALMLFVSLLATILLGYAILRPLATRIAAGFEVLEQTGKTREAALLDLRRLNESMERLLRHSVHDMRTPLTAMDGAAALLLSGRLGDMNERQRQLLAAAAKSTHRLERLVTDLLDHDALRNGAMPLDIRRVDIVETIREAAEGIAPIFEEHGLRLDVETLPAPLLVDGDEARLYQVWSNLLGNAVRFARTEVRLRTSSLEKELRIVVEDDGPGIPEEDLERVFLPFETVKGERRRSQSGLGLAIAREIVLAHNGHIHAENRGPESGSGARFVVGLPLPSIPDLLGDGI